MALEAPKMVLKCNLHMDTRVIKVADFKSEVRRLSRSFVVIELLG